MKRFMWFVSVCLILATTVILPACNSTGGIAVSFVQATTQAVDNGQTFNITAQVKNDSSNKGVTWSLVSGPGTLTNETTTSATYNAPAIGAVAPRSAAQQVTPQAAVIKATSVADTTKSATITINVTPPPFMSNQTLAPGTEGSAYSQQVAETGGAGTLSWQIIATPGPQPAGLTINSGTGVISGTPTGPNATSSFTVKVTDSNAGAGGPQSAQAQVSITINLPAPPKINPAGSALPAGTEGANYSQTLTVSGGLANYTWSVIGNLPAGLHSAQSGTGNNTLTISGTPTGPNGISNFQIKVTDSSNPVQSDTESYSITINLPAPPKISPAGSALAAGTEGTAYSQPALTVSGGLANFTWTVIGSLPAGLTGTQSPGGATFTISGTPTGPNGTSNFQIKVTDSSNPAQSDTENYSITVNLPPAPKISPAGSALPAGTEGTAYSQPFTVSGGLGNFTWTVVGGDASLPAGLHSAQSGTNNNTFTISGTPTGPTGTTNFQIKVTDSSNPTQSDTESYSILINPAPPPKISPASGALPNGNVGTPINQQFTVSGGLGPTFTWSETGALPAGLTFNASSSTGTTVAITGTPTTAQTNVPFSVTVMDSSNPKQSITNNYTLTINPPAPFMITTNSLPNGNFNQFYSTTISAQGGIAPYTFSLDATSSPLPSGLAFSNSNNQGVISGTPTTAGTFTNIIVDAHDSQSTPATDHKTYTLTIMAPTLVFMPANNSSLPTGTQNQVYAGATITATGGVQPYTFTQDATSQLPTGLTFTQGVNQATITGTPTQTGTFNVVVDFQDSEHPPVTQKLTYTLTINASVAACGTGSEALMKGQYTAVLQGHDSSGPVGIGLMFDADGLGGVAKGGVGLEDINSNSASGVQQNLSIDSTKSSYSVGSDHRFCLTIVTGTTNQTFRGSLSSVSGTPAVATNGHIIEFDTTGSNTAGILRKQDITVFNISNFVGFSFAFGASGPKVSGGKFGVDGAFLISTGGNIPTGSLDVNDNGTLDGISTNTTFPSSPVPFTGSSSINLNGHGTFTFNVPGTTGVHGLLYVVSASELLAMSSDAQTTNTLFVGKVLKQTQSSFSPNDLTGKTYVVYTSGLAKNVAGGTRTSLGTFTTTSTSAFNITLNQSDGGSLTTQSGSGTYSVASNGRLLAQITGANHNSALYLASPTVAFALDGSGQVETGFAESQSGKPFGAGSAKSPPPYSFGTIQPEVSGVDLNSGVATFNGAGGVSGTSDDNSTGGGGSLNAGQMFSQSYTIDSTGTGLIPHSGTSCSFTAGTCDLIFIVISPPSSTSPFGRAALMDAKAASGGSNTTPALTVADQ